MIQAHVSYLGEESTPFGYRYVELEITKARAFTLNLKLVGTVRRSLPPGRQARRR